MDTKNILIILATSLVIIGVLLLYRHINTVNNRLNTIELFLNKQSLSQGIPIKQDSDNDESPPKVLISEKNETIDNQDEQDLNSSQQSIERAQNEVENLNNEIERLDRLIDEESENNANINNSNINDLDEENRIENILNETAENNVQGVSEYTNEHCDISNKEKLPIISSEYEELANYNNENNSELNALIQAEKDIDNTHITEKISPNDDNQHELQELEEHVSNENIELNSRNNKIGNEIEIEVIVSKFTLKELKDLCKKNSLSQTGVKKDLVIRLINFNSTIFNSMSNNTINISDN